jgi:hypothetical protein
MTIVFNNMLNFADRLSANLILNDQFFSPIFSLYATLASRTEVFMGLQNNFICHFSFSSSQSGMTAGIFQENPTYILIIILNEP